ncbi:MULTISPECIES: hypothetical protein [unclassified Methylobacterium]|uniref:hypothetical protein n=1 Tax=unclassified Methylobacterium TaxID=2615210 RepID=UPI0004665A0E|nr:MULTISPECIES: hypothetical protein [unclassified Methylobacterium]MBY0254357.1 hypothetical protein [Methylobacterium organophilum]RUP19033.1 MAG: hypothetical protein EKK44_21400 [Methylobacterium sp.]
MQPDPRPLPDSLTRLLAAPKPRPVRARPKPSRQDGALRAREPHSAHAALETAILRGFVFGLTGLVWLVVLALSVRHIAH